MARGAVAVLVELQIFPAVERRCRRVFVALRNGVARFACRAMGNLFKTFARNRVALAVALCTVLVQIIDMKVVP